MENLTPANRSRIPKANTTCTRIRRSISMTSIPDQIRLTPNVGPQSARDGTNLFGSNSSVGQRPQNSRKILGSARGNVSNSLKRPSNTTVEASEKKKPTLGPPANPAPRTKVAPWDFKTKLKIAEESVSKLKAQLSEILTTSGDHLKSIEDLNQKHSILQTELEEKTSVLTITKARNLTLEKDVERFKAKCAEYDRLYEEATKDLRNTKEQLACKERALNCLSDDYEIIKTNLIVKTEKLSKTESILTETKTKLQETLKKYEESKERLRDQEARRKILHNTIIELKGNIRVFCRVRPLIPSETTNQNSIDHLTFVEENAVEVVKGPKKIKSAFSYDRVFPPTSSQCEIFGELAELVQSVIDGYNVCVFAYGQTGSGKTYTMEGGFSQEERGMIPRSIDHIFATLRRIDYLGWEYKLEASFLEIYNEQIRDLLDYGLSDKACEIRNPTVSGGDMNITNLRVEPVTCAEQLNELLNAAKKNRAVAATLHNDHSSRSHFVFKLRLMGHNSISGKSTDAVLNLVDLAGSEKLLEISNDSRVAETKNINKSLSNLGNVILALAHKNDHIPYRNSKLTHLLQTSLGGNSKTLMLVNISPKEDSVEETLNSLRFAKRVNECRIGNAKKQMK